MCDAEGLVFAAVAGVSYAILAVVWVWWENR